MSATFGVGDLVDGKYRIIRVIGEGGWGIVFEGENVRTLKRVAIKILRPHATLSADIMARFEREAQAAGRIGSEHIVEVFDLGTLPDNTHYMVMELLHGEDLATRLATTTKLDPIIAVKIVVQLLEGLACAHNAGILHRDLKPENLYLVPTRSGHEFVKILDFGISKFTQNTTFNATLTGAVLGSPCYMAPEQARGLKQLDGRTDLYAVGTVLFECVTGRVPFQGDNFNDLMFNIVLAPRPNPTDFCPELDPGLAAIIVKAISVEPAARFSSSEEFRDKLIEWLTSRGVESIRPPEPRGLKVTPLDSRARTPRHSNEAFAISHDPTLPADSGLRTPLSASSTVRRQNEGRKKQVLIATVAVSGLLVVGTAVGLLRGRDRNHLPADVPTAAAAAPPTTPTQAAPPPVATIAPNAQDPKPAQDPTPADTASADGTSTSQGGRAPLTHPAGLTTTRIATRPAQPVANAGGKDASAPAPLPAPAEVKPPEASTPAAKHGDTVEGREIRTGL